MITLEQACELALKYTKGMYQNPEIKMIQENKKIWIFTIFSKGLSIEKYYGINPISVDKITKEIKTYHIPSHLNEIQKSHKVKIPKAYR